MSQKKWGIEQNEEGQKGKLIVKDEEKNNRNKDREVTKK